MEGGSTRDHLQIWEPRQPVDDAFRYAVAQVFGVWITAGIRKGQYSNRVDAGATTAAKIERCHRNDCDDEHESYRADQHRPSRSEGGCCATRYLLTLFCGLLQPSEIGANIGRMLIREARVFLNSFIV